MMNSITRWVLAHKRTVTSAWILITLVGFATVGTSTGAFSSKFSVPGREGFVTNDRIVHIFHNGGRNAPLIPVVTLSAGTTVSSPSPRRPSAGPGQAAGGHPRSPDRVVRVHRQPGLSLRRRAHHLRGGLCAA